MYRRVDVFNEYRSEVVTLAIPFKNNEPANCEPTNIILNELKLSQCKVKTTIPFQNHHSFSDANTNAEYRTEFAS